MSFAFCPFCILAFFFGYPPLAAQLICLAKRRIEKERRPKEKEREREKKGLELFRSFYFSEYSRTALQGHKYERGFAEFALKLILIYLFQNSWKKYEIAKRKEETKAKNLFVSTETCYLRVECFLVLVKITRKKPTTSPR